MDEGVVNSGFYAAEGHPIFHAELGGVDHVLGEVSVDFEAFLAKAVADLRPLVEGLVEDLAGGDVGVFGFQAGEFFSQARQGG